MASILNSKVMLGAVAGGLLAVSQASAAVNWQIVTIMNTTAANATESATQDGVKFVTTAGAQKVSYSTNDFDGMKLSDILSIGWTVGTVSPTTNYPPYLNVWVTDGTNYAAIGVDGAYNNIALADYGIKVSENTEPSNSWGWLAPGHVVSRDSSGAFYIEGVRATWSDFDSLTIVAPGAASTSTKAPLYTGFNIVWGDSASNYVGTYEMNNIVISTVPEAASLSILVCGASGLLLRRGKRA